MNSSKEKIESNNIFKNLQNDYFLIKLFDMLLKRRSLDIIKYNKNIKNRININIDNYKEYLELYSSIELEIKPVNNRYGEFININAEDEIYFHIYFNDNKKEIKRNYLYPDEQIKTIKIIINYQVKSFEALFRYCECIESINFKKFYRNNIINMRNMFSSCHSLKGLNLSNFNTNNVTNMTDMFYGCSSLEELNLSNFNTNNVTNMSGMFSACTSLKELNISNFNTNNVTDMSCMFDGCLSLKELNLSNFNTNNVTDMFGMFTRCTEEFKLKIKAQYQNIKEEAFNQF